MAAKRNYTIVIVEDDPEFNEVLTMYVGRLCNDRDYPDLNFSIHSFKSGQKFIEHIDPDIKILVLDYFLESFDNFPYNGLDLIKWVNKECKNCKVIMVSGQHNQGVTSELFKSGIYEYIEKGSMTTTRLSNTIKRILSNETEASNKTQAQA